MFTGIVDHCGEVIGIKKTAEACQLWLKTEFTDFALGESIAVNGACLTVDEIKNNTFRCDISPETLRCTTLQHWQIGNKINLERSMRLMDRLGGHFVSGHVDQVSVLQHRCEHENFVEMKFSGILPSLRQYLLSKGSIAVNGVSLTINAVNDDGFQVMLIPHTLEHTNLAALQPGDPVNIEFDLLAKMVANQLTYKT